MWHGSYYYSIILKKEIFICAHVFFICMGGASEEITRCILGFDANRINDENMLLHLHDISIPGVLLDEITSGDHKVAYCRGHTFLTLEELKKHDPFYEERGRRIDEEGILRTLHGSPSCFGCAYDKNSQNASKK